MTATTYKPYGSTADHANTETDAVDSKWRALYRMGGAAALLSALIIPVQIVVYILWPPPNTVAAWFALLHANPLIGLIDLDLLLVVDNVLLILIFLALYLALRGTSESVMAVATVLGIVGVVWLVGAVPAFEMLSLSRGFAAVGTEAERAQFLAAGQAVIATWDGTAFQAAYFLGSVVGIAIGVVMLRNRQFGAATAYLCILGNAVGFGYYLPTVGIYIAVFSVFFLEVWYILLGRRLLQMGQHGASNLTNPR